MQECIIEKLQYSSSSSFKWFRNNSIKVNSGQNHLAISGKQKVIAEIGNDNLESQNVGELLGIDIDSTVNLENHISKICEKASQMLKCLNKNKNNTITKRAIIKTKTFITSRFGYWHVVWMLHRQGSNSKINSFQERAIKNMYEDKSPHFKTY